MTSWKADIVFCKQGFLLRIICGSWIFNKLWYCASDSIFISLHHWHFSSIIFFWKTLHKTEGVWGGCRSYLGMPGGREGGTRAGRDGTWGGGATIGSRVPLPKALEPTGGGPGLDGTGGAPNAGEGLRGGGPGGPGVGPRTAGGRPGGGAVPEDGLRWDGGLTEEEKDNDKCSSVITRAVKWFIRSDIFIVNECKISQTGVCELMKS